MKTRFLKKDFSIKTNTPFAPKSKPDLIVLEINMLYILPFRTVLNSILMKCVNIKLL